MTTKYEFELTEYGAARLDSVIKFFESIKGRTSDGCDVQFGFGECIPLSLSSYRGFYDHIAIGYKDTDRAEAKPPFEEVAQMFFDAPKMKLHGYKGGVYDVFDDTPVWVANYGRASDTTLVGAETFETDGKVWRVVLLTEFNSVW